jgi:hypothetical protein
MKKIKTVFPGSRDKVFSGPPENLLPALMICSLTQIPVAQDVIPDFFPEQAF